MAAIATDHIVARRTSLTGSIGVIFQYPGSQRASRQARRQGRGHQERAAQGRAVDPFKPTTPEARAVIDGIVQRHLRLVRRHRRRAAQAAVERGAHACRRPHLHRPPGARRQAHRRDRRRGDGDRVARHQGRRRQAAGPGLGAGAAGRRLLLVRRRGARLDRADRPALARSLMPAAVLDRILPESLKLDGLLSVWQGSGRRGQVTCRGAAE